ncbi:hypothetical protein Q2E61_09345 [Microbulbifer thermotolerans]|uniref:hypothetical protein n=1 Tax=Microbulbifer thermotolerans TaxID=252514 RepID=UPI00267185A5|nr:hypothetical protein [Microbulbifer thermotolerans]WKT59132.1 hypothetical protein Q2E61_09345 [Microbulbifer thermotolerans]
MYANPKHLKDHEIKLRVDEETYNLIEAIAKFNRTQKAVLVREFVEAQLAKLAEENINAECVA